MFIKLWSRHASVLQCAVFLAVLCLVFGLASPYFLTLANFGNVLTASAVIGLMAFGATFVIGSGGIDLSTASVAALAGVITASLLQDMTLPPAVAVLVCLLVGAVCGMGNGALLNITGAPSFIVTLGMLSVARAAAYIVSNGMPIYGLPDDVTALGQGMMLGLPAPVWFLLAGLIATVFLLGFTVFGQRTLVLGDNPQAAHAMGLPISALRLKIYGLAGAMSGLAGFIFMARTNSGDPTAAMNYELMAITAVILGGANLFGGKASIWGTLLGVLCLGVLQNGLNLLAISTYYQVLFVGLVLLAAAFLRREESRS